jgi:hypothetical protein
MPQGPKGAEFDGEVAKPNGEEQQTGDQNGRVMCVAKVRWSANDFLNKTGSGINPPNTT